MPSLYFKQRFFEEETLKIILLVGCIILGGLTIINWAFVGLYADFGKTANDYYSQYNQYGVDIDFDATMVPPLVYFLLVGLLQVVINIIYALLLYQKIGQTNVNRWVRVIVFLLIFEFGFNFCQAVWCSLTTTAYNSTFKSYLNMTDNQYVQQNEGMRKMISLSISLYQLCYAATILTWLLAIPIIIIQIFFLLDRVIVDNVETLLPLEQERSQQPQAITAGTTNQNTSFNKINVQRNVNQSST